MKPFEVAIIVAVIAVAGFFFYKYHAANTPQKVTVSNGIDRVNSIGPSPVNAATPIYGPPAGSLVGGQIYTCCGEIL